MLKEKIRFKKTSRRLRFEALGLRLVDGDTAEVSKELANRLFGHWPDNFERIGVPRLGTPLTKLTSTPLVSILIPQRGRPAQIKRCLELILQNTSYPNYEVILICDRDDMASVQEIPKDKKIKVVVDVSPKRQMFVGKINFGFEISKEDYIVYLANDVEVAKNWLTEAMKTMLKTFSDGMGLVAFNHGDPQKHAYHGLISRKFVNQYLNRNIFYPKYIHSWCDLELVAIAKKYNRFCFSSESRVYHKRVKDSIQTEGWQKSHQQGATLLIQRSKMGFPIDREKLDKPIHEPLKISDLTVLTIRSWPLDVIERNLLSYLPEKIELIKLDNENNKNFTSGAQAYNYGIKKAKNNIVICTHEDLVFHKGWFESFIKQECRLKNWGALGIVGIGFDRQTHWGSNYDVPYKVQTLDECCIIVNKKNGLWFDEKTFKHWHSYGVDLCLQAYNKGLNVYVVSGPATHGPRGYAHSKKWWDELKPSHELIKKKWKKVFPIIITTTGIY